MWCCAFLKTCGENRCKWLHLRDCSYNRSWLAADLPEAISSLLMLFHIKQVWEWVTRLAQTSKVIASAQLGNSKSSLCLGVANSVQTSAVILLCSGADLAFHFCNFRLHLAFILLSFHASTVRHGVLLHQHPCSTHISLCLGDVGVERQTLPTRETFCQEVIRKLRSPGVLPPDVQVVTFWLHRGQKLDLLLLPVQDRTTNYSL